MELKLKNMDQKLSIIASVLIGIVSELSVPGQSVLQKCLWILLALFGIYYFFKKYKKKEIRKLFFMIIIYSIPFLFAVAHAFILNVNNDYLGIIPQSFTTSMYIVVDCLMAFFIVFYFKKKSIIVLTNGLIFSYIIGIFNSSIKYGFINTISSLLFGDAPISVYLENHDIGVAVVLLLIYYIVQAYKFKYIRNNKSYIIIISLLTIMFFCGKRSAYIGFIVGLALIIIFTNLKNKNKIINYTLLLIFVMSFLYVILIRTGVFTNIVDSLGINTMNRLHVYDWFSNQYDFSVLYIGKGFQYIHRYMMSGLGDYFVNNYQYLHNSILQLYIEFGFFGFLMWNAFLLFIYPKIISKNKIETLEMYTILIAATYVIYTVDNVLTYPVYVVTFLIILGNVLIQKEKVGDYYVETN